MKRQITIMGCLALIFICFTSGYTYTVSANEGERLEINVKAGLDGKAKEGKGYPVTLTITNNQEDFNGELVITLPVANKVLPVDIASGATKTISFSLPAMENMRNYQPNTNQNEQQFRLYENDWEDGNEVTIDTSLDITPSYIQPDRLVIGVLSDRPDSLNYLKLTTFFGNSPEIINLEESMISEEPRGLDVLDLLVINDYSVAQLPEQKQESIKAWVQNGGTLVTGSEPGLKQQFGSVSDMLPLTITGQENVQQIQGFETIYQEPIQANNIELFTGEIDKEATVLYKEDSIPLVIETPYGKGKVNQVTFDLGLSGLEGWQGNAPLWQSLENNNGNVNPPMHIGMRTADRLADISKTFPALANFKVSTLAILFVGYLLVILPILYLVLKRMDKREWAWIVIPALAIISSIGLYTVGAKDRGGAIKTNMVSVISVDEQGLGSGEGAVSMLSKGAGSYTLSIQNDFDPMPALERYGPQKPYSDLPFVETEGNHSNVYFQQVEFWSPRSVSINHPVKEYGPFTSTLSLANGTISGQVTSNFEFDFQEVYLISGQNYQEIGELAAGESKEISFNVENRNYFQRPTEQVAYQLFGQPGQMGQQNDEQLNTELLSMAIRNEIDSNENTPMLIGFTDESLYPVTINGEETAQNNHHLFMQPTTIDLAEGESSSLSTEISLPSVSVEDGQIYHNGVAQGDPFIDTSGGSYLLTYELPTSLLDRSFSLDELSIRLQQHRNDLSFSLYNGQNNSYDPIEQNQASFNQNPNEKYLDDHAIVIRVSSTADGAIEVPVVTIEGVINP